MNTCKKSLIGIVALCFICLYIAGCRKDREAMFTVKKSSIYLGEKVEVTNQSVNMKHFQWNYGDNSPIVEDRDPAPYLYKYSGTYSITLEASHRKNFNKSKSESRQVTITSWAIDSIVINAIPNLNSWDFSSGPDPKMKIRDSNSDFSDIFISDYLVYFPWDIDSTDLPVSADSVNALLTYSSSWDFSLLDDDFPSINQSMKTWIINPYLYGGNGVINLTGDGFDMNLYYNINQ